MLFSWRRSTRAGDPPVPRHGIGILRAGDATSGAAAEAALAPVWIFLPRRSHQVTEPASAPPNRTQETNAGCRRGQPGDLFFSFFASLRSSGIKGVKPRYAMGTIDHTRSDLGSVGDKAGKAGGWRGGVLGVHRDFPGARGVR